MAQLSWPPSTPSSAGIKLQLSLIPSPRHHNSTFKSTRSYNASKKDSFFLSKLETWVQLWAAFIPRIGRRTSVVQQNSSQIIGIKPYKIHSKKLSSMRDAAAPASPNCRPVIANTAGRCHKPGGCCRWMLWCSWPAEEIRDAAWCHEPCSGGLAVQ